MITLKKTIVKYNLDIDIESRYRTIPSQGPLIVALIVTSTSHSTVLETNLVTCPKSH